MTVFSQIEQHRLLRKAFVAYRKPNSSVLTLFLVNDQELCFSDHLQEKGFVFTTFTNSTSIIFEESKSSLFHQDIASLTVDLQPDVPDFSPKEGEQFHVELVKKGVKAIETTDLEKVVLSRQEKVTIDESAVAIYFQRMLSTYPTAFCYWWYHPEVGEWMGATPEQLLKVNNKILYTVSLAGTQITHDNEEVVWGEKEKVEQQIVTDFIVEALQPYVHNLKCSPAYTFKAGHVMHIKTDIQAELLQQSDVEHVVNALHPTPALCGFPKKVAQNFIIQNEGYPREFYGGYLGEINKNFETMTEYSSDLYVNLRCMKLHENEAMLYLGGGVTAESNPSAEWLETINKSKTIKKIL